MPPQDVSVFHCGGDVLFVFVNCWLFKFGFMTEMEFGC